MKDNSIFSLTEKLELKKLGLSLTDLSKRYHQANLRAKRRGEPILPIYSFYREFLKQLKTMSEEMKIPPKELLPLIDIHAINGYIKFKLLLREEHKLLHSQEQKRHAETILNNGTMVCRHCQTKKPLKEFVKSNKTFTGFISTCKECSKQLRKARKNVEVA